ncbi:hypothetical protein MtrunA17_Chr3g0083651 [Medicago truncatula]|uniref:Uncharacterized protein n=1 Tax=Medicago truncatula TaxID=3880 RepID=A0A396IPF7_MEDTR|nr:hypothetical protein MtrunA17_Chr3g0083651 [Medicago truncatula]
MRFGVCNPPGGNDSNSLQSHILILLRNERLFSDASSAINIDFRFLHPSINRLLRTGRAPKVNDIIELQL